MGGCMELLLDSTPKSSIEWVLSESWLESLLQCELGLLFLLNVFLIVYCIRESWLYLFVPEKLWLFDYFWFELEFWNWREFEESCFIFEI